MKKMNPFEKSGKDVEIKSNGKEGSKKEEKIDAKEMKQQKNPKAGKYGRGAK